MSENPREAPSFWRTVGLLLGAALKRSQGRRTRQRELLDQKTKGKGSNWGGLGQMLSFAFACAIHIMSAYVLSLGVEGAQTVAAIQAGQVVVSQQFRDTIRASEVQYKRWPEMEDQLLSEEISREAGRIEDREGGSRNEIARKLKEEVHKNGSKNLVTRAEVMPGLSKIAQTGALPQLAGSILLLLWMAMMVCQGEGLEMDLQRRRHPMWEWIFSHPVKPGAVFFAEMLSPLAANPIYWCSPLFVGFLYGMVYDAGTGFLAALMLGVPIGVALACLGKALEIAIVLRFPPRSRGAIIGILSWLGYATMMLNFLGIYFISRLGQVAGVIGKVGGYLTVVPWPWLQWFLGGKADGSFAFPSGAVACLSFAGATTIGAIWFSVWGAGQGLSGNVKARDLAPTRGSGKVRFGNGAVYKKELLWFLRDRSAIVQAILTPLTIAVVQMFNFRWVLSHAQDNWNYLCGAAILFGTYFLWVLGPKSLTSEGSALWIALTWPMGLDRMLKAKAWLWSLISTALVAPILAYALFLFPASGWKIGLVFLGWYFFSRSMAEKSVTLVTVTSESGEQQKIPAGRRWAAQLGMLTFAIGILTQHWPLAATGIVYSYMTSAAMWQNLRARLPYLYDPWSEELPKPPTMMHAMISISILLEIAAVLTGSIVGIAGRENIAIAQAIGYGISAIGVSIGVWNFLERQDVTLRDVTHWHSDDTSLARRWWEDDGKSKAAFLRSIGFGAACGIVLGLFAIGYTAVVEMIPSVAETLKKSREEMAQIPMLKQSLSVMAIGFAPFAEEYLFRGLVYRALDREWGGWAAVLGSAAFFAIYHPPLSWVPVGLLGVANALIFKKTGRLEAAVALHMVYNAVVIWR